MRTDELRNELTQLAAELEPFGSNVRRVRGRVARRRAFAGALLLAAAAIPAGMIIARDDADQVVAAPPKSVQEREIVDADALVVVDEQHVGDVTATLDNSDEVLAYARLGSGPTTVYLVQSGLLDECDGYRDGFVVDSVDGADMAAVVGADATSYAWDTLTDPPFAPVDFDLELFMDPDATQESVEALEGALEADPRITSIEHLTKENALAEFRELFKDEPALLEATTADVLPESFRITLVDPGDIDDVERSHRHSPQVDKSLVHRTEFADIEMPRGFGAFCP